MLLSLSTIKLLASLGDEESIIALESHKMSLYGMFVFEMGMISPL